jgi:exodeoxyribonuclease V alpha subunit
MSTGAHTASTVLDTLRQWSDLGWLRRLDSAMAALLLELDPQARPALLVSAALLVHMEGRGHTCLPLKVLPTQPQAMLDWPPDAQLPVQQLWQTLPAGLEQWLLALRSSTLVRCMDAHTAALQTDQGQPLVLAGTVDAPLLYLRRYWLQEQQVAQALVQRTAVHTLVDEAAARHWLDRLFDPVPGTPSPTPEHDMDWQKMACAVALRAKLTVITGGPGTGKTYTAARLLALLYAMAPQAQPLRVALAAPTGKAAARLRQSIDSALQELTGRAGVDLAAFAQRMGAARTLHSLLGARAHTRQFRFHAGNPLDVDVVIVDEASMVHLEMMAALLAALPGGATLILLGDKDQLASVEAGAVLGDLCRGVGQAQYDANTARYAQALTGCTLHPQWLAPPNAPAGLLSAQAQQTVMLRHSRRFGGQIGQLALAINAGDAALATQILAHDPSGAAMASAAHQVQAVVQVAVQGRPGAPACYADYLRLVQAGPASSGDAQAAHTTWATAVLKAFDRFRLVCAVHDGEWGTRNLNLAVQQALADGGWIKPRSEWFVGRPAMVTRNDAELGVFNGDVGITLPALDPSAALRVYFLDGDSLRSVASSRLPQVETAFAMTVHKCQGSEFLHTALVLPGADARVLTRELVYTGITRARECFTLLQAQPGALQVAIGRPTQRASGLAA